MPELGEIRKAIDIGLHNSHKYIWTICLKCLQCRWVVLENNKPRKTLCHRCAINLALRGKPHPNARGSNSPHWKGGMHRLHGYIQLLLQPDDAFYSMHGRHGYVMEHRLVMARFLGRPLEKWELVHHKNGIRDDNRLENLELVSHLENLSTDLILANQKQLLQEVRILRLQVKHLQEQLQEKLFKEVQNKNGSCTYTL